MRLLSLLIFSMLASSSWGESLPNEDEEKQFLELMRSPRPVTASVEVIKKLRVIGWKLYSEGSLMKEDVLLGLAVVGDSDARKIVLEDITRNPRNNHAWKLAHAGNPILLPDMAPVLFIEEEMRNIGSEDNWILPPSYTMATTILETLAYSPLFNGEVINWARRLQGETPTPEVRGIMRDWWKENEKLILKENYKAVKPGRDLANPPVVTKIVNVPIDAPPSSAPEPATFEPAKTEPLPEPPPVAASAKTPESSPWLALSILGGCIALLVIGVFAGRPRKQ